KRALVRQFESAGAIRLRVSEGAFDVTEQLALENCFREPAHVHRDHGVRRPWRESVQRLRDQTLPVPFSPVIKMFASDGATREIISSTGRMAADSAMMLGAPPRRS